MLYIFGSIALVLTALFIVVRIKFGGVWGIYTKTLASLSFILMGLIGLVGIRFNLAYVFILLGLLLGLIGDIVLDMKVVYKQDENKHLNIGMLSFGLGHIMYFVFAILFATSRVFVNDKIVGFLVLVAFGVALGLTTIILLISKPLLKLDFKNFLIQSGLYTFILIFMSALAVALSFYTRALIPFAIGLVLILISDLILSTQYFGGKQDSKLLTILNHSIYYLGQISIAATLFFI